MGKGYAVMVMGLRYYAWLGAVAVLFWGVAVDCGSAVKKVSKNKPASVQRTQMMGGHGMMGGRCPTCGGPMGGHGWSVSVPAKLPVPKSKEWVTKLKQIYALEKLSVAQYSSDENKYRVNMPYHMILLQEEDHVSLISRLFKAYGIKANIKTPAIKASGSLTQALEIGKKIESTSIPRYNWLISHAEDSTTKQVLNSILLQTRMHYVMFTHAIDMQNMGM